MKNEYRNTWYRNWAFWGVIIAAIAVLVTVIIYVWPNPSPKPYFSIAIDPLQGTVQQDGEIPVKISVSGFHDYKYPIYLSIVDQPDGIFASFSPQSDEAKPSFNSNMLLRVSSDVTPSTYNISIKGTGADGEEHTCVYVLTVTPIEIHFDPVNALDAFYPCGWMGDTDDIGYDDACRTRPHSGNTCIKIEYMPTGSKGNYWAGIYWLYPDCNWGNMPDAQDLTGARRLTFWARGQRGGEKSEFKVGGVKGRYPDSIRRAKTTRVITLTTEWQQFEIDLRNQDLSHLIGGFCWVTNSMSNPDGCTIYLDDIYFE